MSATACTEHKIAEGGNAGNVNHGVPAGAILYNNNLKGMEHSETKVHRHLRHLVPRDP